MKNKKRTIIKNVTAPEMIPLPSEELREAYYRDFLARYRNAPRTRRESEPSRPRRLIVEPTRPTRQNNTQPLEADFPVAQQDRLLPPQTERSQTPSALEILQVAPSFSWSVSPITLSEIENRVEQFYAMWRETPISPALESPSSISPPQVVDPLRNPSSP